MIKRIFILLFLLMITSYLVVAVTMLNARPIGQRCDSVGVFIADSIDYGFITKKGITDHLNSKGRMPVGKDMNSINTKIMEKELNRLPLVDNVECYKTSNQKIAIVINQRVPILRVMGNNGECYYIINVKRYANKELSMTKNRKLFFVSKDLGDVFALVGVITGIIALCKVNQQVLFPVSFACFIASVASLLYGDLVRYHMNCIGERNISVTDR